VTTRRAFGSSLLLFVLVAGAYLANGRTIGAGDTLPAAYLPWSLVAQRNFDFDEFPALHGAEARQYFPLLDGVPYYLWNRNGHYLSAYNPAGGALALPVYLVPILMGVGPTPVAAAILEKVSAALITALSVVFFYRALLHVTSRGWALTLALVYALGTSSLSMSSQALWQHGPSQLFLALALTCLVKGLRDERYLAYAGLPMAAAVLMRSTDLLLVLPVVVWIVYAHRARAPGLVLWSLPPIAAAAAYHVVYSAGPERGLGHTTAPFWAFFTQMPLGESLPGLLVSPSRGLFVYSPVLLFSIVGMVMVWRDGPPLWRALSLGPPLGVLLVAKWVMWWGGHSWGPRLLADIDPILCFFLYPLTGALDRSRLLKAAFVVLTVWSVGAHALGAWLYDRRWDTLVPERFHARLGAWTDSPLAFYGRQALMPLSPRRYDDVPPGSRAAAYRIDTTPMAVMTGERFPLAASVSNTGRDVWPAVTPGGRGSVQLGWRWYRGDQEVLAGSQAMLGDVRPGDTTRFDARITAPTTPGDYTLVVDMLSEGVTWFSGQGTQPVRIAVTVLPLDVARMLSGPLRSMRRPPRARLATDRSSYRRDETLRLRLAVRYPEYPRTFDLYYVLEPPDGRPLFFDGLTLPRHADATWPVLGRDLPLPARMTGDFTLPLSSLSPGPHRWHVILTDPGSYRPLVRATTEFTILP
jgi:hypothetical protein